MIDAFPPKALHASTDRNENNGTIADEIIMESCRRRNTFSVFPARELYHPSSILVWQTFVVFFQSYRLPLASAILYLSMWIQGSWTCVWNICTTVSDRLTGCFHCVEYSDIFKHILIPSSSRNSIVGLNFRLIGGDISTLTTGEGEGEAVGLYWD